MLKCTEEVVMYETKCRQIHTNFSDLSCVFVLKLRALISMLKLPLARLTLHVFAFGQTQLVNTP